MCGLKAELIDNVIMNEPVEISNISANTERESITIHANRTIELHEKFMLKVILRSKIIKMKNCRYRIGDWQ